MQVTFDSHVLGKVLFPERRKKDPEYTCLNEVSVAILDGRLKGFICESIGTLEDIRLETRPEYFANRIPKADVQTTRAGTHTNVNITIRIDHDRHPGLNKRLIEKLQRAQAHGLRLLYVPAMNIQMPEEFLSNGTFYESRLFETHSYADRFWEAAKAIEGKGVGAAAIGTILKELSASPVGPKLGMQLLQYARNEAERARISKAIAEWADGDLVASHIASGNDFLCTEDHGRSAGGPSILDDDNRPWLRATYGVQLVSVQELAAKLAERAK